MYPHERSLVKRLEARPFALLGVNSDSSKEELKNAIEKEKMTWRSFFDGPGTGGPIATKWKVQGWPTLYVIDHNGIIRHKWEGSPGDKVMDESIDKLLDKVDGGSKKDSKKDKDR
jgi:peroxiredoxin